jgi:hypothetical protein
MSAERRTELPADRTEFVLSPDAQARWEEINSRPARDLPGLRRLMEQPAPWSARPGDERRKAAD